MGKAHFPLASSPSPQCSCGGGIINAESADVRQCFKHMGQNLSRLQFNVGPGSVRTQRDYWMKNGETHWGHIHLCSFCFYFLPLHWTDSVALHSSVSQMVGSTQKWVGELFWFDCGMCVWVWFGTSWKEKKWGSLADSSSWQPLLYGMRWTVKYEPNLSGLFPLHIQGAIEQSLIQGWLLSPSLISSGCVAFLDTCRFCCKLF